MVNSILFIFQKRPSYITTVCDTREDEIVSAYVGTPTQPWSLCGVCGEVGSGSVCSRALKSATSLQLELLGFRRVQFTPRTPRPRPRHMWRVGACLLPSGDGDVDGGGGKESPH